jgi:calcium permeable stress-gated cation channel
MLEGFSGTASGFLQVVPLAMYYVKIRLLGSTPRSVYSIKYSPRTSNWGTLFPSVTLLVVITLSYSVIAPIINGVALVTFFLLYMLYKYLFTWVNDHPPSSDTGGLFFPKAIQHVFVGLYIQQITLCILFFLPLGGNKPCAIPEGALVILLTVFTVGIMAVCTLLIRAHVWCRHSSTTLYVIHMVLSPSSFLKPLSNPRTAAMRESSDGLLQPQMRQSL